MSTPILSSSSVFFFIIFGVELDGIFHLLPVFNERGLQHVSHTPAVFPVLLVFRVVDALGRGSLHHTTTGVDAQSCFSLFLKQVSDCPDNAVAQGVDPYENLSISPVGRTRDKDEREAREARVGWSVDFLQSRSQIRTSP